MQWAQRHRRGSAWLALVAILLMALAPVLSHALQVRGAATWSEVCTAQGARWVDVDGALVGAPADTHTTPAQVFDHCPWCSLHSGDALLPRLPAAVALPAGVDTVPRLFLAAPRTLFAWLAAQPRGPPVRG